MESEAAHRRIRSALRAELKRRHGQIGQIESELDRSEGYLSRFCRGDMELTLKGCLEVLEALGIEPGSFFSTTFASSPSSESVLRRLAGEPKDRSLGTISQAIESLMSDDQTTDTARRRLHRVDVQDLADEPADIQIRRLRTAKKYRHEVFAEEYLDWLETLRFDDPRTASRLVVAALQYVLPLTAATKRRRIELFCKGLATFAACSRARDDLRTAFWCILQGMQLADAVNFPRTRSDLLRRAAAYCASIPDYETGLQFSREALELAVETDDDRLMGIILVARGLLQFYAGSTERAIKGFQRGLVLLESFGDEEARRSKLSAYSGLVNYCFDMRKPDEAGTWLAKAASTFDSDGSLILGKLYWYKGKLERSSGDSVAAIDSFREALRQLEAGSVVDCALVSIELVSALLEAGRPSEAIQIAKSMASLTSAMRDNEIAQAALVEFLRVVLNGGLNESVLNRLRAGLEGGRSKLSTRLTQVVS